jgi:hypothetical protein
MIVDKIMKEGMRFRKEIVQTEDKESAALSKLYSCPRGHTFETNNPIVIAVDGDTNYNSGPICGYCYVDWFKVNLNANEEVRD